MTFETAGKADLAALRRAVQPVYARLAERAETKAAIAQIEALRGDAGRAPAPACTAGAQAGDAATGATPVDGVYRSVVTMAQLKRAPGFEAGEDNPGNVGRFKLELRNGRFRITRRLGRHRGERDVRSQRRRRRVRVQRRGPVPLRLEPVSRRAHAAQAR